MLFRAFQSPGTNLAHLSDLPSSHHKHRNGTCAFLSSSGQGYRVSHWRCTQHRAELLPCEGPHPQLRMRVQRRAVLSSLSLQVTPLQSGFKQFIIRVHFLILWLFQHKLSQCSLKERTIWPKLISCQMMSWIFLDMNILFAQIPAPALTC